MCGNGARCAARFAYLLGIAGERMSFETGAGIIDAEVRGDIVKVRLTDPHTLVMDDQIRIENQLLTVHSINTGVPHAVHFLRDLDGFDVFTTGRAIRTHDHYQPAGTNANFVAVVDDHTLRVRTYERGVEDETLACGTGSVASALIAARKGFVQSPVDVRVQSGELLRIYFEKTAEGFRNVYLEGKAKVVYQGKLWDEAWKQYVKGELQDADCRAFDEDPPLPVHGAQEEDRQGQGRRRRRHQPRDRRPGGPDARFDHRGALPDGP